MYFIKGTFWSRRHQFVVFHTICSLFSSLIFVLSSFFSLLLSPFLAFSSMFPGFFLLRFPLFTSFRLFMLFPFVFLFPFSLLVPFSVSFSIRRIVVSGRKLLITALNYVLLYPLILCFFQIEISYVTQINFTLSKTRHFVLI